MNKLELRLYKAETVVLVISAILTVLHFIMALFGISNASIVVALAGFVGLLILPVWMWRNYLNRHKPRRIGVYAFVMIMNRTVLYFLICCCLILSCHIPFSIIEARKYRIHLEQERIRHQAFCKYINGEAPIENGVWAYRYIDTYGHRRRGRRFFNTQADIVAPYKNGQLQGLVKEDFGNYVVEKHYTNGQLDSSLIFRRTFSWRNSQPEDTLILINRNIGEYERDGEYYDFHKLCNKKD